MILVFTIVSEYFLTTINVSSQYCKEIFLISLMQSGEINGKAIKVLHCICMFHSDNKQILNLPPVN